MMSDHDKLEPHHRPNPDARTVVPGQSVTYHQTESRPGVKVTWAPGSPQREAEVRALYEQVQHEQLAKMTLGTQSWRNAAIRAVLIEQGVVGRAQLSEAEFDRLVNGLMMRLDGPPHREVPTEVQEAHNILGLALTALGGELPSSLLDGASRAARHLEAMSLDLKGRDAQIESQNQALLQEMELGATPGPSRTVSVFPSGADRSKPCPSCGRSWLSHAGVACKESDANAPCSACGEALFDHGPSGRLGPVVCCGPGAAMAIRDPDPSDLERRIVGLEYQVTELRGNRDVHAKVIAELSNHAEALESTVKALADVLTSVQERARAQDDRIRELRAHAIPDTTDLPAMPSAEPAPDEALRAAQGRCLADGCHGRLKPSHHGHRECDQCGFRWWAAFVAKRAAESVGAVPCDAELHALESHPDYEKERGG